MSRLSTPAVLATRYGNWAERYLKGTTDIWFMSRDWSSWPMLAIAVPAVLALLISLTAVGALTWGNESIGSSHDFVPECDSLHDESHMSHTHDAGTGDGHTHAPHTHEHCHAEHHDGE